MKKLIAVMLIVVLLPGCVACKGKPEDVAQPSNGPIAGDETTGQPSGRPEEGLPVAGGADETAPIEQPDPANPADPAEPSGEEPAKEPEKEEPVQAKEPENKQEPTSGQPTQSQNQPQNQAEPKHGDTKVEDGQKYVYILGFGWIEDHRGEGGGGADVYDGPTELFGNKVGVM